MSHDGPTPALVTPEWAQQHLDDPNVRFVEVDVDTAAYEQSHLPGAVGWDWTSQLSDGLRRDIASREDLSTLLSETGIGPETHIVLYGDNNNWFAAWAYWQLRLHGVEHVSILDGGRKYWLDQGLPVTVDVPSYPATGLSLPEPDFALRAFRDDILPRLDDAGALAGGRALARRVQRRGHRAPGHDRDRPARRPHPGRDVGAVGADGQRGRAFKSTDELAAHYAAKGVTADKDIIAYCRIGERSSHTLVRAPRAARLSEGPQLRRLVDRVGLDGQHADREPRGRLTSTRVYRVASTAR